MIKRRGGRKVGGREGYNQLVGPRDDGGKVSAVKPTEPTQRVSTRDNPVLDGDRDVDGGGR